MNLAGRCLNQKNVIVLTVISLIVWPVILNRGFLWMVTEANYDGGVGFHFYGVVHYFLALMLGLIIYSFLSSKLTFRGLLITLFSCMVLGPMSLILGLSSESLTDMVMLALTVLILSMCWRTRSVFRYAVIFLSIILISIQLVHHAGMTFGPYVSDNARMQILLRAVSDDISNNRQSSSSGCLFDGEMIDECKVFPDEYASGYSTSPHLNQMMSEMRKAWDATQKTQYRFYRETKELSSQWALRFDGEVWAAIHEDNQFLEEVYGPLLSWLFAWATFWWVLTFLNLTVWHDTTTRLQKRQGASRMALGLAGVYTIHVSHYAMLGLFAHELIPDLLSMNSVRRTQLSIELRDWLFIMAGIQLAGLLTFSALLYGFHKIVIRFRRKTTSVD